MDSKGENNEKAIIKKAIITFLLLTIVLSSIFWFIFSSAGYMDAFLVILLMWCPGISAIITSLIFFRSIKEFGWRPGKVKYLIAAYLIPIFYSVIAYGIFWITGLGTFTGILPSNIILFVVVGTFTCLVSALGEEIGWRGFLVPQLAKLTTFTKVAFISGSIWALWHFPLIIWAGYNSGTPLWYALPSFFVAVVGMGFLLAWFRLKSGSLWPAALLHASSNLYLQNLFDPLSGGNLTKYLVGETGILIVIVIWVFAFVLWMMRDKLPDNRLTESL